MFEILLAEDNPADIALVRHVLNDERLTYTLHVAKDGAQALEFIKRIDTDPAKPRLDLMLVDMHLPKHDGDEILRALRSTRTYAETPVIVMSSSESPSDEETAAKHAAAHYFRKPSNLAGFMALGAIVRGVLCRS